VVAVNGDNLYSSQDLSALFKLSPGSAVAGVTHDNPERYGVLVENKGTLMQIIEKPANPPSRLVNTGLYALSSAVWQLLPRVGVSPRGEYELTDAVSLLAAQEPVRVFPIADYWLDFGRPEDIPKVEAVVAKAGHDH
jgi:bifunctional UDP-N-acetylglucosamine pyrophosphorylase/glucosamine-1-phosphate N-acetyltransferase